MTPEQKRWAGVTRPTPRFQEFTNPPTKKESTMIKPTIGRVVWLWPCAPVGSYCEWMPFQKGQAEKTGRNVVNAKVQGTNYHPDTHILIEGLRGTPDGARVLAEWDPRLEQLVVTSSTQMPHVTKSGLGAVAVGPAGNGVASTLGNQGLPASAILGKK